LHNARVPPDAAARAGRHAAARPLVLAVIVKLGGLYMQAFYVHGRSRIWGALLVAIAAAASTLAVPAAAGCSPGVPAMPQWAPPAGNTTGFMRVALRQPAGAFVRVDDRDGDAPAIVGTWRFTWTSDGTAYPVPIPSGAVVDFGTQQWHGDGTELIISGARPPSSGDTCMGSWEQTGPSTYRFRHIGLSWASSDSTPPATPATYIGPAVLRGTVSLNRARNAYEGTFTIDQYARDEVTLLEHVGGRITAARFTVD
jgi:hypothetical protein